MDPQKILFMAEANAVRLERTIVRMWVVIIMLIFMLVGTNVAWIWYDKQFEDSIETTTVTQELDSSGGNAIINDGVHINGENKTDSIDN